MRKWKCVKSNDEKRWTVGKVYTTDNDGKGLCADNGDSDGWNKPWNFFGVIFEEVKEFTKEDLKPCMVVVLRDGSIGRIEAYYDELAVCNSKSKNSWNMLKDYNDSLNYIGSSGSGWDILEVYSFSSAPDVERLFSKEYRELLWKREEKSHIQIEIESIEAEQRILSEKSKQLADRLEKIKGEL